MSLGLDIAALTQSAKAASKFQKAGVVTSAHGLLHASVRAAINECCHIRMPNGEFLTAEVVGFDKYESLLMCYDSHAGLQPGLEVVCTGRARKVAVGRELLGRVIDGIGRPLDSLPVPATTRFRSTVAGPPSSMTRKRIDTALVTGQRAIDSLLTIGMGQRVGLFACSGVGKSTVMGEIAKSSNADINVVALVGERGREVRPFVEDCLQAEGLRRSVVVVATADETPLMRINAVLSAITIAEGFRDEGANVLLFMDSITRLAMAQRELGLLIGEPPGNRGYPPSVQALMASSLERLGRSDSGSITGLITVLVEGDDMDEPVADTARSILDGHIVLKRELAAAGQYPAISVLDSISRVFNEITSRDHQKASSAVRQLMATYAEMKDLIQIGAYQSGTLPEVDRAIQLMPAVKQYLGQAVNEASDYGSTLRDLELLRSAWHGDLKRPAAATSAAANSPATFTQGAN